MCLPTVRVDDTWAQSMGLPSLSATRLGFPGLPYGIVCLGTGERTLAPTIMSHCVLQFWQCAGGICKTSLPPFPSGTWCTTCLEGVGAGTSRRRGSLEEDLPLYLLLSIFQEVL